MSTSKRKLHQKFRTSDNVCNTREQRLTEIVTMDTDWT